MTEAHALSSGLVFIACILDRILQQNKTMQAKSQDVSPVQHMIYGWLKPQDFICRIYEIFPDSTVSSFFRLLSQVLGPRIPF